MLLTQNKYYSQLAPEVKEVADAVKEVTLSADADASVYLFGSRARGDASEESDWDFLILTDTIQTEELAALLRSKVRTDVESRWHIAVSLIVKNRKLWEDDYAITNIYESIAEEAVAI